MSRRRFIGIVSLCTLLVLGLIVVVTGLVATRSDRGQAGLRRWVEARIAGSIHGRVHIGRISGNWLTGVTIDSLEIRDDEDSLFVATGPIRVDYDPRDLVDRRLHLRRLDLLRPVVILRQHENWTWNFKRMFAYSGPRGGNGPERGFGDFVVIDSTHIRDAAFRVTIPWHPDDSLHGARRDSAIRVSIARREHEIRRTSEGYTQTYRWTGAYAAVPYIRIADPDSIGKLFVIDTLHAAETTPPFDWRNVSGTVRLLGDSVWMTVPHFDLPGSTGHASGKVWWGSELPVRYAVRVWGDSVSLNDVAWVYPTLPTTGGGTMILDIRNERDLQQLDYALSAMDVRTTRSHLTGSMTFETGGKVLAVHDVRMTADPVDWDLLRTLNGKAFPADWQGRLTGTVTARGGPLTRFMVDAADLRFVDAHVPGAVSHMTGHGELDILLPAFTAFHHFTAQTDRLELRTLSAIYPAFPKIGGYISGSAVLDSSWLDVRVSNAQLAHFDGPAEPTRATGRGRITYGTKYMGYDLDLVAAPLSLTTLSRSYPKMPLRGTFSGPITVKGIAPDLTMSANLTGMGGHLVYAGHVDADSVGGYGAHGAGSFDALDAASVFGLAKPTTRLAGTYEIDLTGDSLSNLSGPLAIRLQRSEVDGVRIAEGAGRVRFERGIARIDTLDITGDPGRLRAQGVLGLTRNAGDDSLHLAVDVDSLGGLRRYLASAAPPGAVQRSDTLRGRLAFRGSARGWLDSLDIRGALAGQALVINSSRAAHVGGDLVVHSVGGHTTGAVTVRADTIVAGGLRVAEASLAAQLLDHGRARFAAGVRTEDGTALRGVGGYAVASDTIRVQLDSLTLGIGASRWSLRQPMHVVRSPAGLLADTLVLADATGARLAGSLSVPAAAAARIHLRGDSLPLADLARLAQLPTHIAGRLDLDLDVAGTTQAPTISARARAHDLTVGAFSTEALSVSGSYARQRAQLAATLTRGGRSLLDATVDYPIALTLFSAHETGDSLRGRVHADSVDLSLVQALATQVRNATGHLSLDLGLSGTPAKPHVGGSVVVTRGAFEVPDAGVRLAAIDGLLTVNAARDSLSIDRLTWASPANRGTGSLQGSLVYRDLANPRLDLRLDAHALRAVDKRNLARLDVSTGATGLRLVGSLTGAALRGSVVVDRGTIYIPELLQKKLVDLTADDFAMFFDTTDVRTRSLMPKAPGRLVEHLRLDGVTVGLGDDVWLKSKEVNIRLGGSLNVTRAIDDRVAPRAATEGDSAHYVLALTGSLSADRGTYLLDLTPVQREFQVQSGRITFYGTPDFNPEIDVTAAYRVKQAQRADITVLARISGNFYPQPALSLTSDDPTLSPSDLVSYLVTGKPTVDLAASDPGRQAVDIFLPTLGAMGSAALRDQLGSFVDLFQIQSGSSDAGTPAGSAGTSALGSQLGSFLSSTRVGAEKQLSSRLFLSVSTGLCGLGGIGGQSDRSGLQSFGEAIEGKLEYRFPMPGTDQLAIRLGREPATQALRCGAGTSVLRSFIQTPQQTGISVFRSWTF
jgi:translocation and assembly module TamB